MGHSGGRRGQYRTTYYPHECVVFDAGKLKGFLKSAKATTLVEYPALKLAIHVTRTSDTTLHLSNLPPPVEHQDIIIEAAPWGPTKSLTRWFFLCPYCDTRASKLYIPWGATGFGCRSCKSVTYRPHRDLLDELLLAHAQLGRELDAVIRCRARRKDHAAPPTTDMEIAAHQRRIADGLNDVHRRFERHAGHLGVRV